MLSQESKLFKKNQYYKREEYLESYESIALKLVEDDYAWFELKENYIFIDLLHI